MTILKIHIIFSYDQNISLIFLCERWIPCQAVTSVLCLHYRPETVHCSIKDAYTSEITFLALPPWVRCKNEFFLTWKCRLKKLCLCNLRFRTDFLGNSENHLTSFISNYTYLTRFPLWRLFLFFRGFLFRVWRFPSDFASVFGITFVLFST